ncbi:putative metallo-hydrolase YflN [Posidoniimonas polymericola]|uniref:Putative metallo-hydrolase YflN n=1 Tax=Posidoniimonas polymericola TaxID=2528002 RepID=A0A5C5YRY2_9BACT|nr:MBL fold metallo-hydrolase [Posidoniimonas polymericola]TWT77490.1 putative metallo-hydrolase YflN [Posidoniimonas polymericola]
MPIIHPIRLSLSNAYLVLVERPVLVDAGSPGEERKIARAVAAAGVELSDISLILLTHAHRDHAGSARALKAMTGAPVALHPAEHAMLERGHMGKLQPVRPRHALWEPFLNRPFPGLTADLPLHDGQSLAEWGLGASVVETPGHSSGSVSVVLPDGDALAGDLLIGGFLGGLIEPGRPRLPYFAEDLPLLHDSLVKLCGVAAGRWYLGHGGPIDSSQIAPRIRVAELAPAGGA